MDFMVSELEGTLLKNPDPFSYFMLVAFEASGLIRFGLLLMLWPVIRVLEKCGRKDGGLKLSIFVATAGIRVSEIESVARAVLPKFYLDDVDLEAWRVFIRSPEKRVVATKMPRVMVECFVKDHLLADGVIGSELVVNRFGFAIGFVKEDIGSMSGRVAAALFGDGESSLGVRKPESGSSFLSICKEETHPRFINKNTKEQELLRPLPVIFHDGRLVKRPTPSTALLILLWIPIGIIIALIRMIAGLTLPMQALPIIWLFGGRLIVKGKPPPPASANNSGVLFVCTHRTVFDPIVLSYVLQRRVTAVTYSISRFSEIFSPIPTVHLTRIRHVDAMIIKRELEKGDLFLCPEGTTCREPFLLRFSALFAELTDRIVPVAMNYQVEFFHPTRARGWKGLDPFFYFMNPRPLYEVTFLNQLPHEATCSSGKSPYDVANYVQSLLAAPLGFECTHFTRKDKYRVLAGTDGSVKNSSIADRLMKLVKDFHF